MEQAGEAEAVVGEVVDISQRSQVEAFFAAGPGDEERGDEAVMEYGPPEALEAIEAQSFSTLILANDFHSELPTAQSLMVI